MRLLCIIGDLDVGGAETFLMKVFRNIDRRRYMIDFLLFTDQECAYSEEVRRLGGIIHIATSKERNPIKSFYDVYRIVKNGHYRSVLKVSEYSIGSIDIFASFLAGAKVRAFRSTNAGSSESRIKLIINKIMIPFLNMTCNVLIAPSTEAATFTFGKRAVKRNKVHFLNNGVPLDIFETTDEERQVSIIDLDLKGKFIVGHIGRFSEQKNHKFLIDVFENIHKLNNNAVLLLIGDGELREMIEKLVRDKEIEDSVLFLGIRKDIPKLLSVMDVMILPSLYEGMPNVLIEAQALGIPAIVADTVTREANITGLLSYLSLNDDVELWASEAIHSKKGEPSSCQKMLVEKGYDLNSVVKEFISLLFIDEAV